MKHTSLDLVVGTKGGGDSRERERGKKGRGYE